MDKQFSMIAGFDERVFIAQNKSAGADAPAFCHSSSVVYSREGFAVFSTCSRMSVKSMKCMPQI